MLPNLPTDNLYKFLALSGIALLIFGVWVYWTNSQDLMRDDETARRQSLAIFGDGEQAFLQLLNSHSDFFEELLVHLKELSEEERVAEGMPINDEDLKKFELALKRTIVSDVRPGASRSLTSAEFDRDAYRKELAEQDLLLNRLSLMTAKANRWSPQELQQVKALLREHDALVERLWFKVDQLRLVQGATGSMVLFGVVLSIFGFVGWYYRVQIHQDAIAKLQHEKAELELRPKT